MINFFLGTTLVTDLENVVDPEDHLCGLAGGLKRLLLDSEALSNSQLLHVIDFAAKHVDACSCVAIVNF